jgi:hypothetical protein
LKRRDGACWFDSARPRSLQPASDTASAYLRYRHERGEGRYAYAEARASHNRQRFDLGPTAVAIGLYGFTFNSVLREAGNVRPQVRATDADLTFGIGRDQGRRSWDAGISAQRSDVTLSTPGTVRAEPCSRRRSRSGSCPASMHCPPMKPLRCSHRSATVDAPSSGRAGGACSAH